MKRTLLGIILAVMIGVGSTAQAQVDLQWEEIFPNTAALSIGINPLENDVIYVQRDGSFWVSQDAGNTWQQRGNLPNFEDRNIVVNPADTSQIIMYAAGSLWRTSNGGWNWAPVLNNVSMDGESIEYHPSDPSQIFFADFRSGNLYHSGNGGLTWGIRANIGQRFICAMSISPHNPDIMVAGGGNTSIMRSTDGGFNWTEVRPGLPFFSEVPKLVWDPQNPNTVYASTYLDPVNSFLKSTDAGANWAPVGMFGVFTWGIDVDPLTGHIYLGSFHNDANRAIFKSYDGGGSWQKVGDIPQSFTWMLKAGNTGAVYSLSLGQTFGVGSVYRMDTNPVVGYVSGAVTDSVNGVAIEFATLSVTETGDEMSIGNAGGSYLLALPPGTYTLTANVGQIHKTVGSVTVTEGQTTDLNIEIPIEIQLLPLTGFVHDENDNPLPSQITLFAAENGVLPKTYIDTTDAAGNFSFSDLSTINSYDSVVVVPFVKPYVANSVKNITLPADLDIELDVASVMLVDGSGLNDFHTTRYNLAFNALGVSYSKWEAWVDGETVPMDIVSKTKTQTVIWWSRSGTGILSAEMLNSLTAIVDAGYNLYISAPEVVQQNVNHPLFRDKLGIGYGGEHSSFDFLAGVPGNEIGDGIVFAVNFYFQPSRDVLTISNATGEGAFYHGSTTELAAVNITNTGNGGKAVVFGLEANLGSSLFNAFVPVMDRILTFFDANVGIGDDVLPAIPLTNELAQNFPNPFNPSTTIQYQLKAAGEVELAIFNSLGQKVKVLHSGNQTAGRHTLIWDGVNEFGLQVASGIYFYRLTAGDFVQSKRMLLIR